jgi:hypothetical protein
VNLPHSINVKVKKLEDFTNQRLASAQRIAAAVFAAKKGSTFVRKSFKNRG